MQEMNKARDIERRSPTEIAASLRHAVRGATLLVGAGQYSPHAGHARVTILSVGGQGPPRAVWDRFIPQQALPALCDALRTFAAEVHQGALDTMYATDWSFAWTLPPAPLRLYDRKGEMVSVHDGALHLRRGGHITRVPLRDIERIAGWLSGDWVKRGVSIVTRAGERIAVAETDEWMAAADPTYDGIDVMCDASWVGELGQAIAGGLGVPYEAEDPALR